MNRLIQLMHYDSTARKVFLLCVWIYVLKFEKNTHNFLNKKKTCIAFRFSTKQPLFVKLPYHSLMPCGQRSNIFEVNLCDCSVRGSQLILKIKTVWFLFHIWCHELFLIFFKGLVHKFVQSWSGHKTMFFSFWKYQLLASTIIRKTPKSQRSLLFCVQNGFHVGDIIKFQNLN
jgi:hypothetical protein